MALKIVTGRAGSGKTKSIIEDIRKALMERPEEKIYVLVPEQYTLQSERDIVQALELPGLF